MMCDGGRVPLYISHRTAPPSLDGPNTCNAGSGGISVSHQIYNRFKAAGKALAPGDVAIVDGAEWHHYQVRRCQSPLYMYRLLRYLLTCVYDCAYFYRQPTPIYTSYLPCRLLPHHSLTCFRTSVAVAVVNERLIRVVTHLLPSSSRLLFSLDPDLHHHHLHICLFLSP